MKQTNMKIIRICIAVIGILYFTNLTAQNTQLNSYTFGEGINFDNEKGATFKLEGYFQPYFESKSYSDENVNETANRYRMRRMRLRLSGNSANERFSYRFQVDLAGANEVEDESQNLYLLDAYIEYALTKRINVSFGQRATYTDNRELFMNSYALQLVERSRLTSAFATIREFGLFIRGNFKTGGGSYLRPYFVLTTGDGPNVFTKDRGGLKVGGRVDFLPFGTFTNFGQFRQSDIVRERSPKFVIGAYYSINNGMTSRRGRDSGRIIYLNDANNNGALDDGEESLPNYAKFGVDFLFKYQGFSVLGEFIKSTAIVPTDINLRNDYLGADPTVLTDRFRGRVTPTSPDFRDYTPEEYVRRQLILGQAYNIQVGYLFKNNFSLDARFTHLTSDENSFLNNPAFFNRPNHYTLGVTKFLSRSYGAKIQASYSIADGSNGITTNEGTITFENENIFRLILTLAF
jgi:hypothetical protein